MKHREITSYRHTTEPQQELQIGNKIIKCKKGPDTAVGNYYISAVLDDRFSLVSGPYTKHKEALNLVQSARSVSEQHDPRAVWARFGTVRMKDGYNKPGVLQKWGYDLKLEKNSDH